MAVDVEGQGYQRALADAAGKGAAQAELAVLAVMARRLRRVAEGQGIVAAFAALSADMEEIRRLLGEGAATVERGALMALAQMARDNDEWAAAYYEATGTEQVPYEDDRALSAVVAKGAQEIAEQAAREFQTSVLAIIGADGRPRPMAEAYRELIVRVATLAGTGSETRERAIRDAVRELARSGCRVRYQSGATRDLYAAVRANVSAVARETAQGLREQQGKEFGADGVRISAHPNCAEDHRPYQGRSYTVAEFERLQRRLARPIGTHNCRHRTTPVVMGIADGKSEAAERYDRESAELVEVTGLDGRRRTMTRYRATQYQRELESRMRRLDRERKLAKAAGLEDEARRIARERSRIRRAYRRVCRDAGIGEQLQRSTWPGGA